jgi:hypothetical protein
MTSKVNSHLGGYHDLVPACIKGNASHYAKLLTEMMDLLQSDGNWELAKTLEGPLMVYHTIRRVALVYWSLGRTSWRGRSRRLVWARLGGMASRTS